MAEPSSRDLAPELARALDAFTVPGLPADFAARMTARALAEPEPVPAAPPLPRLRGRTRLLRGGLAGLGIITAGMVSLSAAAMGYLGEPLARVVHRLPGVPAIEHVIARVAPRRHWHGMTTTSVGLRPAHVLPALAPAAVRTEPARINPPPLPFIPARPLPMAEHRGERFEPARLPMSAHAVVPARALRAGTGEAGAAIAARRHWNRRAESLSPDRAETGFRAPAPIEQHEEARAPHDAVGAELPREDAAARPQAEPRGNWQERRQNWGDRRGAWRNWRQRYGTSPAGEAAGGYAARTPEPAADQAAAPGGEPRALHAENPRGEGGKGWAARRGGQGGRKGGGRFRLFRR